MNGCFSCKAHQRGLTLVELMISTVISLVILGGVVQSVIASKTTYTLQEEMARMQENSRFALDLLGADIRMAGYSGCGGSAKVTNSMRDTDDWNNDHLGLSGLEGGVDTFPSDLTTPFGDEDAIIIRRGDTDNTFKVSSHNAASAVVHIDGLQSYPVGTVMILADASCQSIGIFRLTGPNSTENNHVNHNKKSGDDGNCHSNLTDGYDCSDPSSIPSPSDKGEDYGPGSKLMAMTAISYYLSTNSSGVPALYQKAANTSDGLILAKDEVIEGVEGMQFTYGIDVDADGEVDRFQSADNVTEWTNVKSVRIQLLMRSINTVGGGEISVDFNGNNYTDNYMRQIVSSTVMLRNY